MVWSRLIRFVDESGSATFGDPCIEKSDDLKTLLDRHELYAFRLEGHDPFELTQTGERTKVERLLGVLNKEDVPVFKCIGLNYVKHSKSQRRECGVAFHLPQLPRFSRAPTYRR